MQKTTRFINKSLVKVLLLSVFVTLINLNHASAAEDNNNAAPYIRILGIAQDAGYPQAGCYQSHCLKAWKNPQLRKSAVSFALIDPEYGADYLFEATPDVKYQLYQLFKETSEQEHQLQGIFLTHAHIGHYAGLIHFGHEVMGKKNLNVYTLPRFASFLTANGPWSQLVDYKNIILKPLQENKSVSLSKNLKVTAFKVPHRDEYSETAGFTIIGPNKKLLFIPDIDRWNEWDKDIKQQIQSVDYALIDATFFTHGELPGRDMSKIKHPLVTDTMQLLKNLPDKERAKVYFIHFNHTNPLLDQISKEAELVRKNGFNVATEGLKLSL